MIGSLVLILASAAGYRVRGSSAFRNVHRGRAIKLAIGAAPVALATYLAGASWPAALLVLPLVMVADTQQHADSMGAENIKQVVGLIAAGALAAAPVMVALAIARHPIPAVLAFAAGLLKAPAYLLGNRLPVHIDRLQLRQGPELGEVLYGAARVLFTI